MQIGSNHRYFESVMYAKKLIDKNYVLINTNIINRKIDKTIKIKERTIGDGWHTDSAKIGKEKIFSEMRYVAIVLLDDFNETNGCTYYIPKSHLKKTKEQFQTKGDSLEFKIMIFKS